MLCSYTVSIEPLIPFISTPAPKQAPSDASPTMDYIVPDDADADTDEASPVPTEASLEPAALQEDAYGVLLDAFVFHREHAWVLASIAEREDRDVGPGAVTVPSSDADSTTAAAV